jgi:hypothetical protein
VEDAKGFYSNAPIRIGNETIYADIYYSPSVNNVVRTISWARSEMIASLNGSIKGYGLYMQNGNGVGYDVVKIVFPIKNANINSEAYKGFTNLKNYLFGH